jgi:hypothetical protein
MCSCHACLSIRMLFEIVMLGLTSAVFAVSFSENIDNTAQVVPLWVPVPYISYKQMRSTRTLGMSLFCLQRGLLPNAPLDWPSLGRMAFPRPTLICPFVADIHQSQAFPPLTKAGHKNVKALKHLRSVNEPSML